MFAGIGSMNITLNQHVRLRREIFRIRKLGLKSDRTKGELDRTKSETISSRVDVSNICVVGLMLHSRMTLDSCIPPTRSLTRLIPMILLPNMRLTYNGVACLDDRHDASDCKVSEQVSEFA